MTPEEVIAIIQRDVAVCELIRSRAEVGIAVQALEAIRTHQKLIAGPYAPYSNIWLIATKALGLVGGNA